MKYKGADYYGNCTKSSHKHTRTKHKACGAAKYKEEFAEIYIIILLGIITLVSIQSYFIREFQAISMSLQPGMTGGTQHTIALYALSARLSHVGLFILFGFICFRQGLGKSFSGAVLIINSAQQLIGFGVFWERLLL